MYINSYNLSRLLGNNYELFLQIKLKSQEKPKIHPKDLKNIQGHSDERSEEESHRLGFSMFIIAFYLLKNFLSKKAPSGANFFINF